MAGSLGKKPETPPVPSVPPAAPVAAPPVAPVAAPPSAPMGQPPVPPPPTTGTPAVTNDTEENTNKTATRSRRRRPRKQRPAGPAAKDAVAKQIANGDTCIAGACIFRFSRKCASFVSDTFSCLDWEQSLVPEEALKKICGYTDPDDFAEAIRQADDAAQRARAKARQIRMLSKFQKKFAIAETERLAAKDFHIDESVIAMVKGSEGEEDRMIEGIIAAVGRTMLEIEVPGEGTVRVPPTQCEAAK